MNNIVLDFFGFSRLPFSKNISPHDVLPTHTYKEAFARLEYGLAFEDIMLITGPVGSGKSVILKSLIHSLDATKYMPIYVRGNNLSDAELYKEVLAGLNYTPPHFPQTARRLFYKVIPDLTRKPIVLIDDAQELQDSALLSLKSMVNFDYDSENKITFIICGQPELKATIKNTRFLALKQRIRVFYHMNGLSLEETCKYIDHHIKTAGNPNSIFSDDAKSETHKHSDGIPRKINLICYRSIINAALKEVSIIDSKNLFLDDPSE